MKKNSAKLEVIAVLKNGNSEVGLKFAGADSNWTWFPSNRALQSHFPPLEATPCLE